MAKWVSPEERAERLRQALQMHVEPVESEGAGHYWMLSAKGFARIAVAIREAEDDALERAAELCDAAHEESLTTRSKIISPDYFVIKALTSRELAAAIRALKQGGDEQPLQAEGPLYEPSWLLIHIPPQPCLLGRGIALTPGRRAAIRQACS